MVENASVNRGLQNGIKIFEVREGSRDHFVNISFEEAEKEMPALR